MTVKSEQTPPVGPGAFDPTQTTVFNKDVFQVENSPTQVHVMQSLKRMIMMIEEGKFIAVEFEVGMSQDRNAEWTVRLTVKP